jgi:hypothetical protein
MSQQSPHSRGPGDRPVERLLAELADVEPALWLIALSTLTIDVYLTYHGLQAGLAEGNPVMASAIHGAGFAMLGLAKAVALGTAGLLRASMREHGAVVPLGLSIPWLAAVLVNAVLLWPVALSAGML